MEAGAPLEGDLRTLSHLANGLWNGKKQAADVLIHLLSSHSAVENQNYQLPEQSLERVAQLLIERAAQVPTDDINLPYYRLDARERFLLLALHQERWSYERLGRILKLSTTQVGQVAWNLRVRLVSQMPLRPGQKPIQIAAGIPGHSCPEFNAQNPWTQRYFDEEIPSQDCHYLQSHLMACDFCRGALMRCRELYFRVESLLPPAHEAVPTQTLKTLCRQGRNLANPASLTGTEALAKFLTRKEVVAFLFFAFSFLLVFRKLL